MASTSTCRQSIRDLATLRRRGTGQADLSLQLDSCSASLAEVSAESREDVAGQTRKPRPTLRIDTDKVTLHYGGWQYALDDGDEIEPFAPKHSSKPWVEAARKEVKARTIAHSLNRCCSLPPFTHKAKSVDGSSSVSRKSHREASLGSLRRTTPKKLWPSSSVITSGLKMGQCFVPVASCCMVQEKLDDVFVSMLTDLKMKMPSKPKSSASEMNPRFAMR